MNLERCFWFDFGFPVCHDQYEWRTMYTRMLFESIYHEEYA